MDYKLYDPQLTGDLIRKERKAITSSREKFCLMALKEWEIDISPESLKKWETGNVQEISINNLIKLCNIFDCELDYLLGQQEYKKKAVADICTATGLSEKSVDILVSAQKNIQHGDTWTGTYGELAVDGLDYNQVLIHLADRFISCFSIENNESSIIDHICKYLLILTQRNAIYSKEFFSPYRKIYRDCMRKNLYTDSHPDG